MSFQDPYGFGVEYIDDGQLAALSQEVASLRQQMAAEEQQRAAAAEAQQFGQAAGVVEERLQQLADAYGLDEAGKDLVLSRSFLMPATAEGLPDLQSAMRDIDAQFGSAVNQAADAERAYREDSSLSDAERRSRNMRAVVDFERQNATPEDTNLASGDIPPPVSPEAGTFDGTFDPTSTEDRSSLMAAIVSGEMSADGD